jgi:multiple sugar transport system substrate-binding protein
MKKEENGNKAEPGKKSLSRRDFLRSMGTTGVAVAATSILNACTTPAQPTAAPATAAPATAAPATAAPATAAPATAVAQPFKGTKIRMLSGDGDNEAYINAHLNEFTALTGIEVEHDDVSWGVLLDQSEVELSSASGNYDVMNMVFIKAVRWMRAGWCSPLDDYVAKSGFDINDFMTPTVNAMSWQSKLYGVPYTAESTQMIYRADVLAEKGQAVPQTFDELDKVLAAIANPPSFYAYVMRTAPSGVHFPFPVWLQGFGGNVFRDPPNDVTPTLNTPEALLAAENFTTLIKKYSIAGSQVYDTPDCQNAMAQGKAGLWVDALGIFPPITNPAKSTVSDKVEIALVPGGPVARRPQIAAHGFQIPAAAKNKDAAWELVKWMSSKEMMIRLINEASYAAVPRISVLSSPEYAAKYNTGKSNIGGLIVDAINMSKCAYRQIPEFPEIGARLGSGLGEILSGQKSVKDAMDAVQKDAEQIMIAGGNKIAP